MVDHWLLKWLLFPFSLLFGLAVAAKNLLYEWNVLSGIRFTVPVISVGNLTVGGAGKTPHVEYLLRLLKPYLSTAVLSRGYGRATTGFQLVLPQHQSDQSGDEPLLFARKYRDVAVAVSESRSIGIPMLLQHRPGIQVIVLDDGFQHRSVEAHTKILLTEFGAPFFNDWLLPVGRLREWRSGYRRADIIIVTKCPPEIDPVQRDQFLKHIRPLAHQAVYFSTYRYHTPYSFLPPFSQASLGDFDGILVLCGIARPEYLFEEVAARAEYADLLSFPDHHDYSIDNLELMTARLQNMSGARKAVLTTEKDAVRLEQYRAWFMERQIPLLVLPVEVVFLDGSGTDFDERMKRILLDFRV